MDITSADNRSRQLSLVFRLAWPVILENLMVTLVGIIDTAMVGSLGAYATSAVALNTSPSWLLNSIVLAANVGCGVLVAHRVGAGDWDGARTGTRESLSLGLLFGVIFCLLAELLAPLVPVWMGGKPEVIPYASAYLRIVGLGYPLYFTGLVLCGAIRGAGDTATPMKITMLANILNVIGNFFLIYAPRTMRIGGASIPMWGAGWGVAGAAAATAASTAISGIAAIWFLVHQKKNRNDQDHRLHISFRESYRLLPTDMKEVFGVGIPTAIERMTITIGQLFFTRVVTSLGTVLLAAHHIAITAESVSYNPGYGLQAAGLTLTGQSIGAKRLDLAERYGKIVTWLGFAVMTICGTALFLFARPFTGLFTSDPEVRQNAAVALRLVAFAQPFFALYIVGSGVLRGLGDARITVPIAVLCMWGIRIPLAVLLVLFLKWGLAGAWIAMDVDLVLRGVIALARLYSGRWKRLQKEQ